MMRRKTSGPSSTDPASYVDDGAETQPDTERAPEIGAQSFVADIARQHGERLRAFLARRLRDAAADVPDLMQEIYLRLLRVQLPETIRSPQAYLFAVANHVLHQHHLSRAACPDSVDLMEFEADLESPELDPATDMQARQRLRQLDGALRELPARVRVTFLLHRQYGFSLQEIADQLGVSRGMVKKYLARAVAHCRLRFQAAE